MKTNTNFWRFFRRARLQDSCSCWFWLAHRRWPRQGGGSGGTGPRCRESPPEPKPWWCSTRTSLPEEVGRSRATSNRPRLRLITLLLPGGRPYTQQKQAVRKVLVYRPLKKRYQGWVGVAISTAVWAPRIATADDVGGFWGKFLLNSVFIGVPTVIAFLVAPKKGGIYNVPPDRRDPSSTGTNPSKQRSGKTVPEVTGTAGGSTGSGVEDISSPDRLRQQARQALLRKGLPLRLPDLTVRGLAAERTGCRPPLMEAFPSG